MQKFKEHVFKQMSRISMLQVCAVHTIPIIALYLGYNKSASKIQGKQKQKKRIINISIVFIFYYCLFFSVISFFSLSPFLFLVRTSGKLHRMFPNETRLIP